jgi:hypothetical protein
MKFHNFKKILGLKLLQVNYMNFIYPRQLVNKFNRNKIRHKFKSKIIIKLTRKMKLVIHLKIYIRCAK